MKPDSVNDDLKRISDWLARRDIETLSGKYDLVVLCGGSVLEAVSTAAEAYQLNLAPKILITGGIGHATSYLYDKVGQRGRPEAAIFADILESEYDIPRESMLLETESTNCGNNASLSRLVAPDVNSILLIQDPTMQRRSHASFERHWSATVTSFAPFIPDVRNLTAWPEARFVSLIMGEIPRLRDDANGYGPNGANFIDRVDIPTDVEEAHFRLRATLDSESR